jgi:hypothetical protein
LGRGEVMSIAKEEARKLLDEIPENATWDDIMYQFYVRKKIEVALREAEAGDVILHEQLTRKHSS